LLVAPAELLAAFPPNLDYPYSRKHIIRRSTPTNHVARFGWTRSGSLSGENAESMYELAVV